MRRKVFLLVAAALAVALLWCAVFLYTVRPAWFVSRFYTVRGVDVSRYQGEIDWGWMSRGLSFAFIKATEGASTIDPYFALNFENAAKAGLVTGAYHFLTYRTPGEVQAANFITAVGDLHGRLPPVVDVELYGNFSDVPPSLETVRAILDPLLRQLETRYGAKPILYASPLTYKLYVRDDYSGYPLWIRNVSTEPGMPFAFWQHSDKGLLPGYSGPEKHIDLNVFSGTEKELRALMIP
jgi:lysozyme